MPAAVSAQQQAKPPLPFIEPSETHDKTKLRALAEEHPDQNGRWDTLPFSMPINPVHVALVDETDFSHEGRMDFVDNRIDPLTDTIRGRAVLDNPDGLLTPGQFVRLRLIGETRPGAVLVPDEAIGADQSNRVVYVLDDKDVVKLRTVTTGRLFDGLRVIRSGLDGSEKIVVSGVQRVRPGAAVTPHLVDLTSVASDGR